MAKIGITNLGEMPDIPDKFKGMYDSYKMLVLLKNEKLTKKELIEKCKKNRTYKDYIFSDSTYYRWIREWIKLGLFEIVREGKNTFLTLTKKGKWVTDANSEREFLERLNDIFKK